MLANTGRLYPSNWLNCSQRTDLQVSNGFQNQLSSPMLQSNSLHSSRMLHTGSVHSAFVGSKSQSFSPLLTRRKKDITTRNLGFLKMCESQRGFQSMRQRTQITGNVADSFFEIVEPSKNHTILQFTDLHYYNNGSREDRESLNLIRTVAERVKPDLVVLTGDIIDGRYCGDFSCFKNVVAPLIELNIPWTYVPGNHDDETKKFSRKDLLNVFKYPLCASKHATSFTHSIKLGPMQIYLMDSNGYAEKSPTNTTYDFIKPDQIEWYNNTPFNSEVGLAFFHIPLVEYKKSKVLIGTKGEEPCTPVHNSGLFDAVKKKKDVHAVFTGHDHWNDFVSELDNVWLCYGRVSGFTTSCYYGEGVSPVSKSRGGRVIRYDSSKKLLSTWLENKKGVERNSVISRSIAQEMPMLE